MLRRESMAAIAAITFASAGNAQTIADFFNSNVLQEVRLTISPDDYATLLKNYLTDDYYPVDFQWRAPSGALITVKNVAIRSRGLSSRSGVKVGIHVDFNRLTKGQLFLGRSAVELKNNVTDASQLNERVAMNFYRRLGMPAPLEAHARLFINDKYAGLYLLVEEVDEDFLARALNDADGVVYKYEWSKPYRFDYRGTDPDSYVPDPFKPETRKKDQDPSALVKLITIANQASDADFPTAIAPYLDLTQFMEHLAVETYLSEEDGILGGNGLANFYLYRPFPSTTFRFLTWDKDNTFGQITHDIFRNANDDVLVRRALAVPQARQAYLSALARDLISAGGPGGWIEQEIDRDFSQIREALLSDTLKQCTIDGSMRNCPNDLVLRQIDYIKAFARTRGEFVQQQLAQEGFKFTAPIPAILTGGIVNAATPAVSGLAPGALASLYGDQLSNGVEGAQNVPVPINLAGAAVIVNDRPAPVIYASPKQINFQIPFDVAIAFASIHVDRDGLKGNTVLVEVTPAAPGIFVATHADGSLVSTAKPAAAGEVIVIYASGLGAVNADVQAGQASPADIPATTKAMPLVSIGGIPATVQFSGLTGNFVGLYQINVQVPSGVKSGAGSALILSMGGRSVPAYSLAVQ